MGRRGAVEALRANRAERILIAHGTRTAGIEEVLSSARAAGVPVEWRERADLERFGRESADARVVAIVRPPVELDDRGFTAYGFADDALIVILDGITDPQNLGACARVAEAAGAAMLVSRRERAAPLTPASFRASAGALMHLPLARVTNVTRAIRALEDRRFTVVGLDHRASTTIHAEAPARPLAVVVGAEGAGMSRLVREACDVLVSIPLLGRTESLNAAAALAVALFGYANRPSNASAAAVRSDPAGVAQSGSASDL